MNPGSSVVIPDGFCTTLHVQSGSSDGDREYLLSFPPSKSVTIRGEMNSIWLLHTSQLDVNQVLIVD